MAKDLEQKQLEVFCKFVEEEDIETVITLQNAAVPCVWGVPHIYIVKVAKELKQLVTPVQYENFMNYLDPNVGSRPGCWLGCNLGNHMVYDFRETKVHSLVEQNADCFIYSLTNIGRTLLRQLSSQNASRKSIKAIEELISNLESQGD